MRVVGQSGKARAGTHGAAAAYLVAALAHVLIHQSAAIGRHRVAAQAGGGIRMRRARGKNGSHANEKRAHQPAPTARW
jgi:hypothetical protein